MPLRPCSVSYQSGLFFLWVVLFSPPPFPDDYATLSLRAPRASVLHQVFFPFFVFPFSLYCPPSFPPSVLLFVSDNAVWFCFFLDFCECAAGRPRLFFRLSPILSFFFFLVILCTESFPLNLVDFSFQVLGFLCVRFSL